MTVFGNLTTRPLEVAPATVQKVGRIAGPAIGGTAGAIMGARGGLAGATAGAGLGATAGDLAAMGVESLAGAPPTLEEFAERTTTAGPAAAVGEGLFGGAGRVLRMLPTTRNIARYAVSKATPDAGELITATGGRVLPSEIADSPFLQLMENLAAGSPMSRAQMQRWFRAREDAFVQDAERLIGQYGPRATRQQAGGLIRQARVGEAAGQAEQLAAQGARRRDEIVGAAQGEADRLAGQGAARREAIVGDAQSRLTEAERTMAAAQENLDSLTSAITGRFGAAEGLERSGRLGQELVEAAHDAARQAARQSYKAIDEGWNVSVDMTDVLSRVDAELGRRGAVVNRAAPTSGSRMLERTSRALTPEPSEGEQLAGELANYFGGSADAAQAQGRVAEILADAGVTLDEAGQVPAISFESAHELRAAAGRAFRRADRTGDGQLKRAASILQSAVDDVMETAADAADPAVMPAYRAATAQWRAMVKTFEEGALAKAVEAHPTAVLKTLFGPSGTVSDIVTARREIGPEGWQVLQAQQWQELTHHPDGTPLDPKTIAKNLRGIRLEQLKAFFGRGPGGAAEGADDPAAWMQLLPEAAVQREVAEEGLTEAQTALRSAYLTGAKEEAALVGQGQAALSAAVKEGESVARGALTQGQAAVQSAQKLRTNRLVVATLREADAEGAAKLRAIMPPDDWRQVQSVDLQLLLGRVGEDAAGDPNLLAGKKLLQRLEKRGKDAFTAAHDMGTWNKLWQFARVRDRLARATGDGGTGKMWIQLATPSAAVGVITGVFTGSPTIGALAGGTTILLGPRLIARVFTSPRMRDTLIAGMQATATGNRQLAGRLTTQLLAMMAREGIVSAQGPPGRETVRETEALAGRSAGAGPGGRPTGAGAGAPARAGGAGTGIRTPGRAGGAGPGAGGAGGPTPPPVRGRTGFLDWARQMGILPSGGGGG